MAWQDLITEPEDRVRISARGFEVGPRNCGARDRVTTPGDASKLAALTSTPANIPVFTALLFPLFG